ncbi:MAG: DUF2029 domain-containing protein [Planctomycetes bacterium]|nr:DUF2029 domain-containing protein [Planctomycetota bacterium]
MQETNDSNRRVLPRSVIMGWCLIAIFVAISAGLVNYRDHLRYFQLGWLISLVGYAAIVFSLSKLPGSRLGSWRVWLIGIALFRVALIHTVPSDDLHRYVWEGKIQRFGLNPYTTLPIDVERPELTQDDPNWSKINHPDYPAIYPPLAQLLFRLTSSFGDSIYTVKFVLVLFELLAILLLGRLLVAHNLAPHWASLYALCPLSIASVAIEGHQDSMMLAGLALMAIAASRKRFVWCGVWLGAAISVKTVAIVLVPWLLFRRPIALLATAAVCAACYLPYSDAGWHVFDSLYRFGQTTTSMGLVATTLSPIIGEDGVRILGALSLLTFAMWLASKRTDLPTFATRSFAALILVMPVVHAWYLTWFLFFSWARIRFAWLVFCGAAVVYFEAEGIRAATGQWNMPTWVFYAWYAPFGICWFAESALEKRKKRM